MCKSCVKVVYSLLKSRKDEHKLYAAFTHALRPPVLNPSLSTISTPLFSQPFSTIITTRFDLLNVQLSTLYTGPITRALK